MIPDKIIKENWFTRKPFRSAKSTTLFMVFMLLFTGIYYFQNTFNSRSWMPASRETVFLNGDYWRLWTTLWAHGDWGHLINNALLFVPLTYLLAAYFTYYFFPILGLFMGGVTNALVLMTMPEATYLIGISGVVYWMGGAWFTLFLLIDRRKNLRHRFANVLFLMLMVFIPETYTQNISYLSHFIGFILGVLSSVVIYGVWYKTFKRAEVIELQLEDEIYDLLLDSEASSYSDLQH